jgi:hypothetical protein
VSLPPFHSIATILCLYLSLCLKYTPPLYLSLCLKYTPPLYLSLCLKYTPPLFLSLIVVWVGWNDRVRGFTED